MYKEFMISNSCLKDLRLTKKLTQEELAKKLNCSLSTIQKIEQIPNYFLNCNLSFILDYFDFLGIERIYYFKMFNKMQVWTNVIY